MELTRPHLIQAYRAAVLRESLRATVSGMRSGIEAEGTAMEQGQLAVTSRAQAVATAWAAAGTRASAGR